MPIEIKVIRYKGRAPVKSLDVCFNREGGTIGRSTDGRDNHLTLPDPERYISRNHVLIAHDNGRFTLTDNSVDGTYINDKNRCVRRETVTLADGDRIWIGEYELRAHIFSNGTQKSANDIFQLNGNNASFSDMDRDDRKPTISPAGQTGQTNDHDWWSGEGILEESAEPGRVIGQPEASPMHDAFSPPDIMDDRSQSKAIPTDFNFEQLFDEMDAPHGNLPPIENVKSPDTTTDSDASGDGFEGSFFDAIDNSSEAPAEPQADQRPSATKSPPNELPLPDSAATEQSRQQVQRDLVRIFMDAAGIDKSDFPEHTDIPQLMSSMGATFREMVNGLMAVLRGRTELKTHLRVEATSIRPEDNNPLKFFREVDEALRQLLTGAPPGFVDARSAVREGFADIMNHQMAMNAGMQAALIDLIGRFDPQGFAKPYADGVVFQKKAKAWDAYQEAYKRIANEALENVFGKPFADAYEAQIKKLTSKPKQR